MTEPALDFRRYAPASVQHRELPRLAWSQPDVQPRPGELAQLFGVIRNALALIAQCLRLGSAVLWRRWVEWFETRVLHCLPTSWAIAGIGWGGFVSISVLQYFTR